TARKKTQHLVDGGGAGIEAAGNCLGPGVLPDEPELANGESRDEWETPIGPILYLQITTTRNFAHMFYGISAEVSCGPIIRGKCPLAGGNIDDQVSLRRQVVQNGVEKLSFLGK